MKHGDLVLLRSEVERCDRRLMAVTGVDEDGQSATRSTVIDVAWLDDHGTLQEFSAAEDCFVLETELEDQ